MSSTPSGPSPQPSIIIDRRSGRSWIWRLLSTLFTIGVAFAVFTALIGGAGISPRGHEQHEAGPLLGPKVAIVSVSGTIAGREVENVVRELRQARADDRVQAVVLRINSPGGTLSGSDEIWREIRTLQGKGKPVVASMGGMAASGGYYVATPCDVILAEPTTLTGSIGVLMEMPELGGLLEKVGVRMETLTTGPWKDSPSMFRPLSASERERWQGMIAKGLDRFVRVIAQGRKLDEATVRSLADGRVFTAEEALEARLIDSLGYLDDALLEAQRRASLPEAKVVRYTESRGLMDLLFSARAVDRSPWADLAGLFGDGPQILLLAR
jgi:protease-4